MMEEAHFHSFPLEVSRYNGTQPPLSFIFWIEENLPMKINVNKTVLESIWQKLMSTLGSSRQLHICNSFLSKEKSCKRTKQI
ncbi:hypothetical protein VIGAN_11169400 [Vigna angularis var. angularis]|uniref:Uncharacterized protein n=1 Tax=Vigna angularis var. angularis TaxID=157739 RepID=A0A0S3TB30_PHAAN|nr:hypothetical protein VIGAN_11169400 [Vigna angularis var. angularis]